MKNIGWDELLGELLGILVAVGIGNFMAPEVGVLEVANIVMWGIGGSRIIGGFRLNTGQTDIEYCCLYNGKRMFNPLVFASEQRIYKSLLYLYNRLRHNRSQLLFPFLVLLLVR